MSNGGVNPVCEDSTFGPPFFVSHLRLLVTMGKRLAPSTLQVLNMEQIETDSGLQNDA